MTVRLDAMAATYVSNNSVSALFMNKEGWEICKQQKPSWVSEDEPFFVLCPHGLSPKLSPPA